MRKLVVRKTVLGIPIPFTSQTIVRGTGKFVAWDYGYDLIIKKGVFKIHHKSKLSPTARRQLG